MTNNSQNLTCANNTAKVSGRVISEPCFSHEIFGERFFTVTLDVKRLSQASDYLPVTFSEKLLPRVSLGNHVMIEGQFRSYNKPDGLKSKLLLTVFAIDICAGTEEIDVNNVTLTGFLCKEPIFRTTPFNREISDLLLAVNRSYNKSDYIPCIAWGRNARYIKYLPVGEQVTVVGRIQSRDYVKKIDETNVETRTAYEVSISRINVEKGAPLEEPQVFAENAFNAVN